MACAVRLPLHVQQQRYGYLYTAVDGALAAHTLERMKKLSPATVIATLALLGLLMLTGTIGAAPAEASIVRDSAVTLPTGQNTTNAVLVSPDGASAYFGLSTNPGTIVKVDTATMVEQQALTLNSGENLTSAMTPAAIMSPDGVYGYFATDTTPARVVKVDLTTMTRVSSLTLNFDDNVWAAAISPDGAYGYFGTYTGPGRVVKVQLSNMTRVGAVITGGVSYLQTGLVSPDGAFAYFSSGMTPSSIVKIDLTTFQIVGSALTLNAGEGNVMSAAISPDGAFAYYGTGTNPGILVKVDLASFTRVGSITFPSGEGKVRSTSISPDGAYAYTAMRAYPGIIEQVDLATFTRVGNLTLNTNEDEAIAAVSPLGDFLYAGTRTWPAQVVKLRVGWPLTVTLAGTGTGAVASSTPEIDCGSTCRHIFHDGASVTLTATASGTSTFTGWSGACSGTGTCTVSMSAIRDVTATFAAPEAPRAPAATTSATTTPTTSKTAYSPAPGVTRGASRGRVILAAQTPAAGQHLLLGARIWVRSTSRTEIQASSLPKGLELVNGKLVGSIAGTYRVQIKVLRTNGTTVMRTITVQAV
jgi:hypothetical protein